jgi:prepilin-type N-terminal cleavage/methylation domain-containing protein
MVISKINRQKGFTLVEMVVCISIMAIISSVILGSRASYTDQLSLKNDAYRVALAVRQAQVYSLGVRGNTGQFNSSYGVSVDNSITQSFAFFSDINSDRVYTSDELLESASFQNNVVIDRICGIGNSGSESCPPGSSIRHIDVTFNRPDPKATIRFINNGGADVANLNPPAIIYLRAQSGKTITVRVEATGAVSVQ